MSKTETEAQSFKPKNKFMIFKESSREEKKRAAREFFINNLLYILLLAAIVGIQIGVERHSHSIAVQERGLCSERCLCKLHFVVRINPTDFDLISLLGGKISQIAPSLSIFHFTGTYQYIIKIYIIASLFQNGSFRCLDAKL